MDTMEKSGRVVNAGVIGAGRMGQYHIGVYSEIPGVNLVGIMDADGAKAAELAKKYNTTAFSDYRELFGKVDVLSIAVPTSLHYKIAKDCLAAGVSCLVEKPICNSLKEAEELFNIAEKKGVALHVGHVERFNGAVQELKKVVHDPIFIESHRMGPFDARMKADGVILDLLIHDLDIILNLVESPVEELNVIGSSVFTEKEDVVNVQIRFENGCLANMLASRVSQEKIRNLAVSQEKEYIFLDYTHQEITVHRQATSRQNITRQELRYAQESLVERIFVHKDNPLKLELMHLIDCAVHGADRRLSVESELLSLKIALEALSKLKLMKKVLASS